MRQLKLEIEPYLDAQISDFAGPSWAPVIDNLRQFHTGLIRQLFIYGSAGSGKSHLLSAICDSFSELGNVPSMCHCSVCLMRQSKPWKRLNIMMWWR